MKKPPGYMITLHMYTINDNHRCMAPDIWSMTDRIFVILDCFQWHIQRFFGNTIFSRRIQGRSPKGHNRELWTTIFSYKHVWMAWVGVIYYGKCNYYALINCIRHCVRGEIKIKFIKIFSFLLIWDKNLGSHIGWPVAKPLWIRPWTLLNTIPDWFNNFKETNTSQ